VLGEVEWRFQRFAYRHSCGCASPPGLPAFPATASLTAHCVRGRGAVQPEVGAAACAIFLPRSSRIGSSTAQPPAACAADDPIFFFLFYFLVIISVFFLKNSGISFFSILSSCLSVHAALTHTPSPRNSQTAPTHASKPVQEAAAGPEAQHIRVVGVWMMLLIIAGTVFESNTF